MIVFTLTSLTKWLVVGRYQAVGLAATMSVAGVLAAMVYVGIGLSGFDASRVPRRRW